MFFFRIKCIFILLTGSILLNSALLQAQFSPGDLTSAHASLEGINNCTQCHDLGKKINSDKCIDCHSMIKTRVQGNKGYHGSSAVKNSECIRCHLEHKGRGFDIVHWENGKESFTHELTGYKLEGGHFGLKCEQCHQTAFIKDNNVLQKSGSEVTLSKTFLGLSRDCRNCHFDEHRGQLTQNCYDCHDYKNWKESSASKFNHSRSAFPLTGKHSLVACERCHPTVNDPKQMPNKQTDLDFKKYTGIKFDRCTYCHKDPHDGKFGLNCQKCHTPGGWLNVTISGFDHGKTNYPLTGKHIALSCEKCHQPDAGKKAVYKGLKHEKCKDCHADAHLGQFMHRGDQGECESCHTTGGFVPSLFTTALHNTQSRFRLEGSHQAVACNACHIPGAGYDFKTHTGLSVIPARPTAVFKMLKTDCGACHEDVHQGQFADQIAKDGCASCHQVTGWDSLRFDHNLQSVFPLKGKHQEVACIKCHKPVVADSCITYIQYRGTPKACEDCHQDYHYGQFTKNNIVKSGHCDQCHAENGFRPAVFDHNKQSRFQLTGKHENVACAKCHLKVVLNNNDSTVLYKPINTTCSACHADL